MTMYQEPKDQIIEFVTECLTSAEFSITRKGFGYPTAILLLCVIDAMGNNFPQGEREKLNIDYDLGMLAYPNSDFGITEPQIRNLRDWYRNKLVHMGRMAPGTVLRGEDQEQPFVFAPNGELNTVYVLPFYRKVKTFWDGFD